MCVLLLVILFTTDLPVGDSDESPPDLPEQTSLIHALASQGWVCRNRCRSSRVRGRPVVTTLGYHGTAADHTDSCPEFLCGLFCSLISHHDLPPAVLTFHSQGLRNARWPSSMLHRSRDSEDGMRKWDPEGRVVVETGLALAREAGQGQCGRRGNGLKGPS